MSATLSELQFYNTVTGGNATNVVQGRVQYINYILGTDFGAVDAAEKAYWEYLKQNNPVTITADDAVVSNEGVYSVELNEVDTTLEITVENSVITAALTAGDVGVVTDGQEIPVTGGTVTISVTDNEVTAEFTAE